MPTIFEAAETGDVTLLIELQKAGANLNAKNNSGNTPLLLASYRGRLPAVQWLLQHGGAQIAEKNPYGNTALLLAAAYGHLDTVKWLLTPEAGAILTETNEQHNTPLLLAAKHKQIAVSPDDLLRLIVAEKINEQELYSAETKDWSILGVEETPIARIIAAYETVAQDANAADDIIPQLKPAGMRCSVM